MKLRIFAMIVALLAATPALAAPGDIGVASFLAKTAMADLFIRTWPCR